MTRFDAWIITLILSGAIAGAEAGATKQEKAPDGFKDKRRKFIPSLMRV